MSETITIGSRQVPRTVVGAISRLELITAKHAPSARADVDFLRARFNEVEAQRDELVEALRKIGSYPKARSDEMSAADMRLLARVTMTKIGLDAYGQADAGAATAKVGG